MGEAPGDRPRRPRRKALLLAIALPWLLAIGFGTWNAIDNAETLAVVGKPASKAERAKGIVRGLASFHAEGKQPVPPCIASYRNGKSTKHTHFSGDNRVTFDDGTEYLLPESQKIEFFQNDGPNHELGLDHDARVPRAAQALGELVQFDRLPRAE